MAALAAIAAAQEPEVVPLEKDADAFFAAGNDAGRFGPIIRTWRVPDLGKLEFVEVDPGKNPFLGWRSGDVVYVGLFYARRVPKGAAVRPADRTRAIENGSFLMHGRAQGALGHWFAALRRGEPAIAARAWRAFRERADPPPTHDAETTCHNFYAELMFTWRTVWHDPARPEHAVAALDALESLAQTKAWKGLARRQRVAVLATPREVPPPPEPGLPPEREAEALVARFRELGPGVETTPGGTMVARTRPGARLLELEHHAYPALVAALEHQGLSSAWTGGLAWHEYITYGAVARELLQRQLGFVDDPPTMRRWIESGTWRDPKRTRAWFAQHASDAKIRESCRD
jgi:hypothetical protein